MIKVKNFTPEEFDSPDAQGSGRLMDDNFILKLQEFREIVDEPVIVTSGYRTENHNEKIGGAKNSAHLHGVAADIRVTKYNIHKFVEAAIQVGFNGIGINRKSGQEKGFMHLDTKPRKSIWTY